MDRVWLLTVVNYRKRYQTEGVHDEPKRAVGDGKDHNLGVRVTSAPLPTAGCSTDSWRRLRSK